MVDLEKLVDELSKLTVLEAAELSKKLEEKWGVTAVAAAAPVAIGVTAVTAEVEKDEFTITLLEVGPNKINVIKEIRTITSLGLKEAKDLVDGAPQVVKEGAKKDEVEAIKKKLEDAGAKVQVK